MISGGWKAVGVALAIGALAACGGKPFPDATGADSTAARAVLLRAASHTEAAKSARISISATFGGSGGKLASADVHGDGTVDFVNHDATMTLDVGSFGQFEERVVGGIMYVRLPAGLNLGGGSWMRIDLGKSGGASFGLEQTDPTQILSHLRSVSNDVVEVGPDTVRGVATTHYRATITDLGKGGAAADVWIDANGYARKATLGIDIAGSTLDLELEMYDFGVPVHVEAPPASDVVPFGGALGAALGGALNG